MTAILKPLVLLMLFSLTPVATSASVDSRDFPWYCQSDEATAAQKHTVGLLFDLAGIENKVENCEEAFDTLSRYSYIELKASDIEDLAPLSGLERVNFINAPDNKVASLAGLNNLPKLKKLWLSGNAMTEFPAIDGFPLLNNLVLNGNPIATLTAVTAHPRLQTLRMSGTAIKDYAPLAKLKVSWLQLANTKHPEALATLPEMPTVMVADLSGNALVDFGRFKVFAKVDTIIARSNSITSLKDLEAFESKPSNLQLAGNTIEYVDSPAVLQGVASLDLSDNPLADFTFLAPLRDELNSLNLSGTSFDDGALIARFMPHIYQLDLSRTPLSTLPILGPFPTEWPNVYVLKLQETKITSFAPFKSIKAPKLRRFEGPALNGATEATCPTGGVPDLIAGYCQEQIGGSQGFEPIYE